MTGSFLDLSPFRSWTFDWVYGSRHGFLSVEWASSPVVEVAVTPKTSFDCGTSGHILLGRLVYLMESHSLIRLSVPLSPDIPQSTTRHCAIELAAESFQLSPNLISLYLSPYISSELGSFQISHEQSFWWAARSNGKSLYCFGGFGVLPDQ